MTWYAALRKSAFGTKQTCQSCRLMSAFGGKADIVQRGAMFAFDPKRTLPVLQSCSAGASGGACAIVWVAA